MIAETGNPFDVVFAGKPKKPTPVPGAAPAAGDLMSTLQQAGFRGAALKTAYAVAKAESGGRSTAFNPNAATGDKSYGLFQINMLGNLGPARRAQYGLKSNEDLYDPLTNAKVAYRMSGGGKNWSPWSAYKSGAYKQYLTDAPSNIRELPIATGPAPAKELPLAKGFELDDNPFAAVFKGSDNPFDAVFSSRPEAQPAQPAAAPGAVGKPGAWVGEIVHRSGPSKPHTQEILNFVGNVAATYGQVLTPWGNESHSITTVNGNRSAHADGRAADIPASGKQLIAIGRAALVAAGADPAWAAKQNGGLFNIGSHQIIFNTDIGGNHHDHVHVGLRG